MVDSINKVVDVVVIGAGAAGLMCAITAGYRGRRVLVLDHANKPGKKILMSGGGRCNFTHLHSTPANYLSANPHFCISALKRYTPYHFTEWVERHGVEYHEKTPGQLFCTESSKAILDMLLTECEWAGVDIRLKCSIDSVQAIQANQSTCSGFTISTSMGIVQCESLVIATGGLSIPTMGASPFGYKIAEQFGLNVLPTRAGLAPFTLQPDDLARLSPLSGVSCPVEVKLNGHAFKEPMLFTHRGLSGPAMLQISSFWQPGQNLHIDLLPDTDVLAELKTWRQQSPNKRVESYLTTKLPKRLAQTFVEWHQWNITFQQCSNQRLNEITQTLKHWKIKPNGTEGYRTAEVTLGGVDTDCLSSKTMAVKNLPNLFFIGEVVDVTGHLGGHNFQWAWASGFAAGNEA
ncbi:NAD(P)/FAD-dependent oxidoreductase [Zooshikella sp. RANM57]|uniref:NAD(P)/FAD-dependent oxidoreductase n=1 Tax=Zooshikella sp. RANM57 TaxID=3425863 RepID=UPI003D6E86E1